MQDSSARLPVKLHTQRQTGSTIYDTTKPTKSDAGSAVFGIGPGPMGEVAPPAICPLVSPAKLASHPLIAGAYITLHDPSVNGHRCQLAREIP